VDWTWRLGVAGACGHAWDCNGPRGSKEELLITLSDHHFMPDNGNAASDLFCILIISGQKTASLHRALKVIDAARLEEDGTTLPSFALSSSAKNLADGHAEASNGSYRT
jgi:hypothetical protein